MLHNSTYCLHVRVLRQVWIACLEKPDFHMSYAVGFFYIF